MPTFNELGKKYSQMTREALDYDLKLSQIEPTQLEGGIRVKSADLFSAKTRETLLKIAIEIDGLVISETKKPLTEKQKLEIYVEIAKELGLPGSFGQRVKSASNDDLTDLTEIIEILLQGG